MIAPRVRSNYSVQRAFAQVEDLVDKAIELGLKGLVLADTHTLSGHVEFVSYVEKVNKKSKGDFRAILGMDVRIQINDTQTYLTLVAKNKNGWLDLIKILKKSKLEDSVSGEPYIVPDDLHLSLENCFAIFNETNKDNATLLNIVEPQCEHFVMGDNLQGNLVLYCNQEDSYLLKIATAARLKCTIKDKIKFENDSESRHLLESDQFFLRNDTDPNNTTDCLLQLCEPYSLASPPNIPTFIRDGKPIQDIDEFLTELCREGWKSRGINGHPNKDVYTNRIKYELDVIKTYKLSNYFCIIWDISNYVRGRGFDCGLRGSAVGCLISYLIGISQVDPVCPDPVVPYDSNKELLFSRFLNKGRLAKGNVSLPDIDLDVPIGLRGSIIEYIKKKYGNDCVGHIITFLRMDGKMAIKEVFRVLDKHPKSYEIANNICSYMIETDKVQDELELEKEDNPDYNIINYCIDNIPKVAEFYEEYTEEFDIAIKLSNSIKSTGKHAAGIVIASQPLEQLFPVALDKKSGEFLVALEMANAEYVGAVKYDILGVAAYDKMYSIDQMIEKGLTEPIVIGEMEENEIFQD